MANNGLAVDRQKMRLARQNKGWTVRDVSRRCEELGTRVHFSLYAKYERGPTRPGIGRLYAIATALDLKVEDLLLEQPSGMSKDAA